LIFDIDIGFVQTCNITFAYKIVMLASIETLITGVAQPHNGGL